MKQEAKAVGKSSDFTGFHKEQTVWSLIFWHFPGDLKRSLVRIKHQDFLEVEEVVLTRDAWHAFFQGFDVARIFLEV